MVLRTLFPLHQKGSDRSLEQQDKVPQTTLYFKTNTPFCTVYTVGVRLTVPVVDGSVQFTEPRLPSRVKKTRTGPRDRDFTLSDRSDRQTTLQTSVHLTISTQEVSSRDTKVQRHGRTTYDSTFVLIKCTHFEFQLKILF